MSLCESAAANELANQDSIIAQEIPADVGWNIKRSGADASTAGGGVKGFAATAANIKSTNSNLIFEIRIHPIAPQPERLLDCKVVTEIVPQRNDNKGPFKDYDEFQKLGVEKISTKVRSCNVQGLPDVRIVLPEAYALRLDADKLVEKDPGTGLMSQRVTPADLPQLIDEMPDPRYFKRIFISDRPNPEDDWVTQTYFSKGFVSSTAMVEGELFLYKTNLTDYLRRDLMHEWGHELRYKYWNDPVKDLFHDAVLVEKWNPRTYAARGDSEQWAVLGEKLLGTSANDFVEACDRAPIRTTLWMMTLKRCLNNVPKHLWTEDQKEYSDRVSYVEREVRGKAMSSAHIMRVNEKDSAKAVALDHLLDKLRSYASN